MRMAIVTATAGAECMPDAVRSWGKGIDMFLMDGTDGMIQAYQRGYEMTEGYDVLAYLHDDVFLYDEFWKERILREFEDRTVGLVGLGGALGWGDPYIYKKPYDYKQLGRYDFLSNMKDAENHGKRFTASCRVAVLDGFALIVRRKVLQVCGGWDTECAAQYIGYDYKICAEALRQGYQIRLAGIACEHKGGQTFVKLGIGQDPKWWQSYLDAHQFIYNTCNDVLPVRINQ